MCQVEERAGDYPVAIIDLERYRSWLGLLARLQMDARFRAKFDASDIVQQTLLEAVRDWPKFRGGTEAELAAWLRQILAHVLLHEVRRYGGAQRRAIGREVSLEEALAESSRQLGEALAAPGSSPSAAPAGTSWSCAWPTLSPGSRPITPRSSSCATSRACPMRRSRGGWGGASARCGCSGSGPWPGSARSWRSLPIRTPELTGGACGLPFQGGRVRSP